MLGASLRTKTAHNLQVVTRMLLCPGEESVVFWLKRPVALHSRYVEKEGLQNSKKFELADGASRRSAEVGKKARHKA